MHIPKWRHTPTGLPWTFRSTWNFLHGVYSGDRYFACGTLGHFSFRRDQSLKHKSETRSLVWDLINMQNVITDLINMQNVITDLINMQNVMQR